jgi:hypothetical protein
LYGLLGVGYKPVNNRAKYVLDIGLGAHIVNHRKFFLNTEYASQINTDFKNKLYETDSFKILTGYNFNKMLRLFAGPSINLTSAEISDDAEVRGWVLHRHITDKNINTSFIGVTGGLQFVW